MTTAKSDLGTSPVRQLKSWERITPEDLLPAIKHIRKTFDNSRWKCSEITEKLCFSALHPQEVDPVAIAPYVDSFKLYRAIIGRSAQGHFDAIFRSNTPPAIFLAFREAFCAGLKTEIHRIFPDLLEIGLASRGMVEMHPVEWAKSHLGLLIEGSSHLIPIWTKAVCDKQEPWNLDDSTFDDYLDWTTWRAPKLIHMQPGANSPFEPSTAWVREDEPTTAKLLEWLSSEFVRSLQFELDRAAGDAYVTCAKTSSEKQSQENTTLQSDSAGGTTVASVQQVRSEHSPPETNITPPPELKDLPPKKVDLEKYFDGLTEIQRQCASLRWEHGLGVTEIARRLGRHHSTIQEILNAAAMRMKLSNSSDQRSKRKAAKGYAQP